LLIALPAADAGTDSARDQPAQINVALSCFEELKRRTPAK
jgi:hypothetical protein